MGTKKDFRVKTGLVVEDGDVTLASDHSVKAGIFDTNVAAAGVTLTGTTLAADGTDSAINIDLTPKGTGEVNITKVDIDAGTIDGATIATSDIDMHGKTLDMTDGTLTLDNNQISGDKVEGGTIAATTITALTTAGITATANLDIGAYTITGTRFISDIATGTAPFAVTSTTEVANLNAAKLSGADWDAPPAIGGTTAAAGTFSTLTATTSVLGTLGGNVDHSNYNSTNVDIDSGAIDGTTIGAASATTGLFTTLGASGAVTVGSAGSGADVTFHSATSGDHMLWDASEEQLKIIGTSGQVALDIDTGNFTVGAYGLTDAGAATIASMAANWTNAGRTVADLGIVTTADINGGTIDSTAIGATTPSSAKVTTLTSSQKAIINDTPDGGAVHATPQLTVIGDEKSSGTNGSTLTYAEALLYADISNDDIGGTWNGSLGLSNALVLENAEDVDNSGQGIIFTVGTGASTGSVWGLGRQTGTGIFTLGYHNDNWEQERGSANDPMKTANSVLEIDTSGNATLMKNGATLAFHGETSGGATRLIKFKASPSGMTEAGDKIYTLPVADGSSGHVLKTNGSGTLSWAAESGASGSVNASGTPVDDQVALWTDATTMEGNAHLTYSTSGLKVGQGGVNTASESDFTAYGGSSGKYLFWDASAHELGLVGNGAKLSFYDMAGGENISADNAQKMTINAGLEVQIDAPTLDFNASTAVTIDTATSTITSTTAHNIVTPSLVISDATTTEPIVQIKNTTNDQTGSELRFVKDKGAAGAANDVAGKITFYSDDASQNNQAFGQIQTKTTAATAGSETGEIGLSVATSGSGALAEVLVITGGAAAASSTVDVKGHLIVRGTTTTVNSTEIDVADVNINLGNGIGNDAAVDGGGITLESTDSNKTFNWVDSTDAWTSSEHMNLLSGKAFKIAGTSVLNATTLGTNVVASSLTSVGTLTALTVDNIAIDGATIGHTGDTDLLTLASGIVTVAGEVSATTLDIGGTNITSTAAELNYNDTGSAVGTVVASKTLTVDANRDVATIRNLTSDGAVQGATLSADAVAIIDTGRGSSQSITGATSLMNISKTTYKAAKVLYHIKKDGTDDTDAGEILITYDGGDDTAYLTHYAEISTGSSTVGTWDATVNSGNIEVRFTPGSNGNHTWSLCTTQLIT